MAEKKTINQAVEELQGSETVLVDLRGKVEYQNGHIPGAINIPFGMLRTVTSKLPDRSTPLAVYCESGTRSKQAVRDLKDYGYTNVTNIGGFMYWKGEAEK